MEGSSKGFIEEAAVVRSARSGALTGRRFVVRALQIAAAMAFVVFLLLPVWSLVQVLLCLAAITIVVACANAARHFDDKDASHWSYRWFTRPRPPIADSGSVESRASPTRKRHENEN
jgi:uncharacterized membrane protein YdbT with pleckstrin-like domain